MLVRGCRLLCHRPRMGHPAAPHLPEAFDSPGRFTGWPTAFNITIEYIEVTPLDIRDLTLTIRENISTLGLRPDAYTDITSRLVSVGVSKASDGSWCVTAPHAAGQDVLRYCRETLYEKAPHLFTANADTKATRPGYKADGTRMSATQRLAHANGDQKPKL